MINSNIIRNFSSFSYGCIMNIKRLKHHKLNIFLTEFVISGKTNNPKTVDINMTFLFFVCFCFVLFVYLMQVMKAKIFRLYRNWSRAITEIEWTEGKWLLANPAKNPEISLPVMKLNEKLSKMNPGKPYNDITREDVKNPYIFSVNSWTKLQPFDLWLFFCFSLFFTSIFTCVSTLEMPTLASMDHIMSIITCKLLHNI